MEAPRGKDLTEAELRAPAATDRRNTAEQRAKQALGRMGDFWALMDMAANVQKAKPFMDEMKAIADDLAKSLAESRDIREATTRAAIASATAQTDHAAKVKTDLANVAKATGAVQERLAAVETRETDCTTREQAISTRENGVTAREVKLTKDTADALASLAQTRADLQEMADQLSMRKADLDAQQAAFERRFQAAKAIIAAVPDDATPAQGGENVGRDATAAHTR